MTFLAKLDRGDEPDQIVQVRTSAELIVEVKDDATGAVVDLNEADECYLEAVAESRYEAAKFSAEEI